MSQTHGAERPHPDVVRQSMKAAGKFAEGAAFTVAAPFFLVAVEIAKRFEPAGYKYPRANRRNETAQ